MLPFIARNLSTNVTFSPSNYGPLFAPRSVIMLRNSLEVGKTETRLVKQLYWLGLRVMTWLSLIRCKRAIAVSKYAEQSLTFGLRKLLSKVEVIYHGVQNIFLSNMNQIREDFFLVVSDIYIQKNIHNLLIALATVTDKFPNAKLKIASHSQTTQQRASGAEPRRSTNPVPNPSDEITHAGTIQISRLDAPPNLRWIRL